MTQATVEPTQASATGVRRSGRISKEIPILLSGADAAGRQFSETTRTLLLSLHGASVICHQKLIPEQEAYLRVISNSREIEVRICGQIGEREDGYIYGVAFADPKIDFWRMEFPPAHAMSKGLIPVTLECSGCRSQISLQFDATEMDVYTVNEGSLRYCSRCALSTIWKIATSQAESKPPAISPERDLFERKPSVSITEIRVPVEPAPAMPMLPARPAPLVTMVSAPAAAARSVVGLPALVSKAAQPNRRSERRTRVKYEACIRVSGWGEEVVPCEDMSRGGFCFHSKRQYSVETMIEAAVPYTAGGVSIFVPAQIANAAALPSGIFRYGAAYIRSPKR